METIEFKDYLNLIATSPSVSDELEACVEAQNKGLVLLTGGTHTLPNGGIVHIETYEDVVKIKTYTKEYNVYFREGVGFSIENNNIYAIRSINEFEKAKHNMKLTRRVSQNGFFYYDVDKIKNKTYSPEYELLALQKTRLLKQEDEIKRLKREIASLKEYKEKYFKLRNKLESIKEIL